MGGNINPGCATVNATLANATIAPSKPRNTGSSLILGFPHPPAISGMRYIHLINMVANANPVAQQKIRNLRGLRLWISFGRVVASRGVSVVFASGLGDVGVERERRARRRWRKKSRTREPHTAMVTLWRAIPAMMRASPAVRREELALFFALAATPPPIA